MVFEQLIARGIKDEAVLRVFREVPREMFMPREFSDSAYNDHPIPIGNGQTISQPYIVALMTEKLSLKNNDKVLEIGTGSGYQAAILAKICGKVYSIERFPNLAERAENVLRSLKIDNVEIKIGDGTLGWDKHAPYDAIIVTASAPEIPMPLIDQLAAGGRLIIPIGDRFSQLLIRFKKTNDRIEKEEICGCVFVPLVGRYGWQKEKSDD